MYNVGTMAVTDRVHVLRRNHYGHLQFHMIQQKRVARFESNVSHIGHYSFLLRLLRLQAFKLCIELHFLPHREVIPSPLQTVWRNVTGSGTCIDHCLVWSVPIKSSFGHSLFCVFKHSFFSPRLVFLSYLNPLLLSSAVLRICNAIDPQ
jgi:hypothetical protein